MKNHLQVLLVFSLILVLSACSPPSGETGTPLPSPSQEIPKQATATMPPEPTPTARPLPPDLVESAPLTNSELGLDAEVVFHFNQAMERSSVEAAFSGPPGRLSWRDDSTLVYAPETPHSPAEQLHFSFDQQAMAANGLKLVEPINLVFSTVGYLDLGQMVPEPGTRGVAPGGPIVASFNRPVVPLGADPENLPAAFSLEPQASGQGEWINTSTYLFSPQPSLAGGTEYSVRIADDLVSLDGTPLQNQQSWSFITAEPSLLSIEPEDGARDVNLDSAVLLSFDHAMDPESLGAEFTLREDDKRRVSGDFTWNEDETEFTFTPDNLLKRDRFYSVELGSETLSAGGTPLGTVYRSGFETIPELLVIGSDPENRGQKEVFSSVAIEFNSPINYRNILQFFTFDPPVIDLQANTDESGRTLWLGGYFEPDTAYRLMISPNLSDKWNSRLGQEFNLDFRTRPLDPNLAVIAASDVIFLTPNESSITLQATNLNELTYSLGIVPLEDFRTLMTPGNYVLRQTYRPERELTLLRNLDIPPNVSTPVEISLSLDGGPLAPGIYFLRITTNAEQIQPGNYFLIVSDINTTLKLGATDALVWAINLKDGSAAGNMPVMVFAESGELLAEGATDEDGVLYTDIPIREMEDIYGVSYAVLGETGTENFSAALSNWSQGLDGSSFGYPVDYGPPHLGGYIYTDRPIYRPGQLVNFRVVLRETFNGRYALPEQSNLILRLVNDFGEQTATLDLSLSEYGTAHGRYRLDENAMPGTYRFVVDDDRFSSVTFQVAEYRKPEIDVEVFFTDEETIAGEESTATVSASYFFGAAAAEVPIQWTLTRIPAAFHIPGYQVGKADTRWLSGLPSQFIQGFQEEVQSGEGESDATGKLTVELRMPVEDERFRYTLEATAVDESGAPVSARGSQLVNPADIYIGVKPDAWSGRVGSQSGFDIQVVDWNQEPAGEQPLIAEYSKVVWERIDPQPGDLRGFPVYEPTYTPAGSVDLVTGSDGIARIAFTPAQPGTYQLQVNGSSESSETATTQIIQWVGGPGQVEWPTLPNRRLRLTADKDSYQPGETAQVFVPNPFGDGAAALVTIERGILFDHQVLPVNGTGIEIPVDLGDEEAPNVYLSVTLIDPDEAGAPDYRQGYLAIPVEPVQQTLVVSLTSDPVAAEPGGEIILNLLVTDSAGTPLEGEFSLSVVDLAVLALAEDNSEDIVSAFYKDQPLGINTSLSLAGSSRLFTFGSEGIGGGGGELAEPVEIREEFLDTAYWNADVMTGADGQAQVRLRLPDNVTSWQMETRGVTQDTRVGQDNNLVISTKDLLVRPVTPRFFITGDHAQLAAVVHNNTEEDLQVEIALQEIGFTLDEPDQVLQEVRIEAGGRERVEWWGTVGDVERVDLIFTASAGELTDSSRPVWGELPVLHYTAPQTFGTSGTMDEGGERMEVISLPRSFDPQNGGLQLEMAPTLGAAMMSGLEMLEFVASTNTEQVVSRFLPNLETYRVIQEFGLDEPGMQIKLEQLLDESILDLVESQNPDGGWSWWREEQSDRFITAYVVLGLLRASEAGVELGADVISPAVSYLIATQPTTEMLVETWQLDRQAFIQFVLSETGEGDLVGATGLFESRSRMNPWAQALLALTFENLAPGDERSQVLYADLEAGALRSATGVHWENQETSWQNMSTTVQTTAVVLYTLANQDPASPLVAEALRYLMAHRDSSGAWTSTYESAWALMAAAEVMQGTGELGGEFVFYADINDIPLVVGEAVGSSQLTPVEASIAVSELYQSEPNSLMLTRGDGSGRLYYTAHLNVHRPVEEVAPLDGGVTIRRSYFPGGEECQEGGCPAIEQAGMGELVTGRLTLTIPETAYYLIVEDYIPAGAEILDVRLDTTQTDQLSAESLFGQGWGWWEFGTPRIFDDRISWAADQLPPGTYELVYQMVTTQPGEYRVLPPRAFQLYFPEVQGNGAGTIFKIRE